MAQGANSTNQNFKTGKNTPFAPKRNATKPTALRRIKPKMANRNNDKKIKRRQKRKKDISIPVRSQMARAGRVAKAQIQGSKKPKKMKKLIKVQNNIFFININKFQSRSIKQKRKPEDGNSTNLLLRNMQQIKRIIRQQIVHNAHQSQVQPEQEPATHAKPKSSKKKPKGKTLYKGKKGVKCRGRAAKSNARKLIVKVFKKKRRLVGRKKYGLSRKKMNTPQYRF